MSTLESVLMPLNHVKLDMPNEVAIAFNNELQTKEGTERLRRKWLVGNNHYFASLEVIRDPSSKHTAIFRPQAVTFDLNQRVLILHTPSKFKLFLVADHIVRLGTENVIDILNDYMQVEFNGNLEIINLTPLRGTTDTQTAGQILAETNAVEALITGLGYSPTHAVIRTLLPRLLSWFKVNGNTINTMQFTQANTGKTTYGLRSEMLFNWEYINETPTLARLVADARTATLGTVHLRNGMIFDEVDKWKGTLERFQTLLAVINTGLEQGKWTRGVSTMGVGAEITRHLPIVVFGNLPTETIPTQMSRLTVSRWLTAQTGVNMEQFIDRFAVVDIMRHHVNISGHITYKVLPDNIMRGIVKVVQDRIVYEEVSELKGRSKFHANRFYAVTKALGYNFAQKDVDILVSGADSLDRYFMSEAK